MIKINKKSIMLVAIVASVLLVSTIGYKKSVAEDNSQQGHAMSAPAIKAIKIDKQDIQLWKSFSGRANAVDIVDIRPQVSGTITKVNFVDGQQVNKGDLLFVIDPRILKAEVKKLEADLKAAKNQEENAKRNYYRAQELRKTNTVSQRNYEDRETTHIVARSNREAIEANLDNAKVKLDYAHIKSPITGKISRAEHTLGNLVASGGDILTSVVSDSKMYIDFKVDEQTYLKSVRATKNNQNIPVKVSVLGDDKVYEGNLSSFDNRIDTSAGTIRARAIFDNEDQALISGMFVTVSIGTPVIKDQIIIPEKSVGTNQNYKFVYVINKENMIEYTNVILGESVNGNRVVKSGLKIGDVIVKEGLIKVRPGMPVTANITK